MKLKAVHYYTFLLAVFFLLVISTGFAQEQLIYDQAKVKLEFEVKNNLSGLEDFYPSINTEKLCQTETDLDSVLAGLNFRLEGPVFVRANYEYGYSVRQINLYQMTGDALEFYQEIESDQPLLYWNYYDLAYLEERYRRVGLYCSRKEQTKTFGIILRADLFIIPDYRRVEIIGSGRTYTDLIGAKQAELSGNYKKGSINETGWGGSLSCATSYNWDSGSQFKLSVDNLLSMAYFPSYIWENGKVDSTEKVLTPIFMSGYETTKTVWRSLPVEIAAEFIYPVETGEIELNYMMIGELNDCFLSYNHLIFAKTSAKTSKLIFRVNPSMQSLGFGYHWGQGQIVLSVSPTADWRLTGLGIAFCY